jgi:hypothetical protein
MITNPTPNQTRAIEILNCIAFLKTQTGNLADLAKDETPMPDGVGTVASAIKFAASELELPYLEILDAGRAAIVSGASAENPPLPATDAENAAPAATETAKMPEIVTSTAPRKKNTVNGREVD